MTTNQRCVLAAKLKRLLLNVPAFTIGFWAGCAYVGLAVGMGVIG